MLAGQISKTLLLFSHFIIESDVEKKDLTKIRNSLLTHYPAKSHNFPLMPCT